MSDIDALTERLRRFNRDRDWEQFHTTKNLLLALVGEVGELASLFQWQQESDVSGWMDDSVHREQAEHELADVLAYLIQIADSLDVDLVAALNAKIDLNDSKYPAELSRGSAAKYTELGREK